MERVGLIPAAGRAERLGRLPCSKEIYPVGVRASPDGVLCPAVACDDLLVAMRRGGARRAFVVLGHGKWDVAEYLGDGSGIGLELAYLPIESSPSTPATAARAAPFLADALVLFGFPDILFEPTDCFERLAERRDETGADVVLGLFPAPRPEKVDMVATEPSGRVREIVVKPSRTDLHLAWIVAVWTPRFTDFLRAHAVAASDDEREQYVGDVVRAALASGFHVDSASFPAGRFRDIGTFDDLALAFRDYDSGPRPTPA